MVFDNVPESEKEELSVTMAALILHSDKVQITEDNLEKIVSAAGGSVQPFWFKLFADLLHGKDIGELLLSSGGGGIAAPAPSSAPATGGPAPGAGKDKPVDKDEDEADGSGDEEMGFSLFED
eukprot:TRINITY_DN2384_c0_g1_i1.p1 TRINITY_DN2384_c0_g1~~TRINITY_DN2384_c0_g1_i1.p1  ORF type:complete len:122 (-),score=44.28 TRINITY_DN2384_c0_g1_i1:79-444(-)